MRLQKILKTLDNEALINLRVNGNPIGGYDKAKTLLNQKVRFARVEKVASDYDAEYKINILVIDLK